MIWTQECLPHCDNRNKCVPAICGRIASSTNTVYFILDCKRLSAILRGLKYLRQSINISKLFHLRPYPATTLQKVAQAEALNHKPIMLLAIRKKPLRAAADRFKLYFKKINVCSLRATKISWPQQDWCMAIALAHRKNIRISEGHFKLLC